MNAIPPEMDSDLTRALQAYAADHDLANRTGSVRLVISSGLVLMDRTPHIGPRCACGNLITIIDRNSKCRQCVLQERLAGL